MAQLTVGGSVDLSVGVAGDISARRWVCPRLRMRSQAAHTHPVSLARGPVVRTSCRPRKAAANDDVGTGVFCSSEATTHLPRKPGGQPAAAESGLPVSVAEPRIGCRNGRPRHSEGSPGLASFPYESPRFGPRRKRVRDMRRILAVGELVPALIPMLLRMATAAHGHA